MSLRVRSCDSVEDVAAAEASFPTGPFAFHERRFLQGDGSIYLLAWLDESVVGHVVMLPQSKYPEVRDSLGLFAEVNALAVAESHRRQGVATALMWAAEEIAQTWGHERIGLAVEPDNNGAIQLYEFLGFRNCPLLTPTDSWQWTDEMGRNHDERMTCAYWVKDIATFTGKVEQK